MLESSLLLKHPWLDLFLKVLFYFTHKEKPRLGEGGRGQAVFFTTERRLKKPEFMVESKPLLCGTQFLRVPTKSNLTLQDQSQFQRSLCHLLIMMSEYLMEQTEEPAWEFPLKEYMDILSDTHKNIVYSQPPC